MTCNYRVPVIKFPSLFNLNELAKNNRILTETKILHKGLFNKEQYIESTGLKLSFLDALTN